MLKFTITIFLSFQKGDGLIVHFTPVKKIKLSPSQAVDGIAKINFMREIWPGKKKNVFINNKGDDFNMT